MNKRRCGVGVAVLDNYVYAIGGHDGTSYLQTVEKYDPIQDNWSTDVATTSTCRTSVGVAVLDGYLYAIGGQVCFKKILGKNLLYHFLQRKLFLNIQLG